MRQDAQGESRTGDERSIVGGRSKSRTECVKRATRAEVKSGMR